MSEQAWHPLKLTDKDKTAVAAVRDLAAGKASAAQQRAAWAFIVERVGGFYDLSFRPDAMGGPRDTAFHEGRRFVAAQLQKIATLPMDLLIPEEDKPRNG